jgi:transposase InsO family protein
VAGPQRAIEALAPGQLLCQDTLLAGPFSGVGELYLHLVIDCCGGFAFGRLDRTRGTDAALALLDEDVLRFYASLNLWVGAIETDLRRLFTGRGHRYRRLLAQHDIRFCRMARRPSSTPGIVETFEAGALDGFVRPRLRDRPYAGIETLQAYLDLWLHRYNFERKQPDEPCPWERLSGAPGRDGYC